MSTSLLSTDHWTIEYTTSGAEDGAKLLVHHGLLGGAEVPTEWSRLAEQAGVAILAVARPAYGRSTPVEMTSFADWPTLVTPLLDHVRWQHFDVLGLSAGAPYAYALAAAWPDRVGHVFISSGVGDVHDPAVLDTYPPEAQDAFGRYARGSAADVAAEMRGFLTGAGEELPADHPWHSALPASLANGTAGPAREAKLQVSPWQIDWTAITAPVASWHGRDDQMVPWEAAQRTVTKVPHADFRDQPAGGHGPDATTLAELFSLVSSPHL